jgi:hypothetical protein
MTQGGAGLEYDDADAEDVDLAMPGELPLGVAS